MCGVTSHNVTHDVTGSVVAPKAKKRGACERLSPTNPHSIGPAGFGGTGARDYSSNVYQKT